MFKGLKIKNNNNKKTYGDLIQRLGKVPSWGMELPTYVQIFNPELFLCKGNAGTKCGTQPEGKAIQRLPHLRIHPMYRHQT